MIGIYGLQPKAIVACGLNKLVVSGCFEAIYDCNRFLMHNAGLTMGIQTNEIKTKLTH